MNMRYMRRILSALLVVCMMITMFPASAAAADSAEPSGKRIVLDKEAFSSAASVWVDGVEYPVIRGASACYVDLPEDAEPGSMVTYTYYVGDASDVHTQYPNSMKVWALKKSGAETYSAERLHGLDNALMYSGMSIRITGNKGIRMITSIEQSTKDQLVFSNVDGYHLLEYGTVIAWASSLKGGKPLVLNQSYTKHNYAYKRDVSDPVFNYDGSKMQYTNVLIGFSMEQCAPDICMRSYMILEDSSGNQITIYGGTLSRSIGYIAWQNRYVFTPGSDSYNYVWEIIRSVYGDIFEVQFNSNGGSSVAAKIVENGKTVSKPADPEKAGFEFAGWYMDSSLTRPFDFTKPVTENVTLYAKWEIAGEADTDGDGVPGDIEEMLGLTEGSTDSDGDGITDYIEIYEIGSDPKAADSDQDYDYDGLTNYEEVHTYKTDPVKPDTDMDGLTDGEEVKTYGSNPLTADTDGDHIEDGNEILLGTDPHVTENIKHINQGISEETIAEALRKGNDAVPAITGTADGVLDDMVSVKESVAEAIRENRSVVGKGVEITVDGDADLTLSFDVPDTSKTLAIMRMDEEGGWTFQDTKTNSDMIWTDISNGGTYCVMDLDVLLPLIGVDVSSIYSEITSLDISGADVDDPYAAAVQDDEPVETEAVETEPVETEAVETEPVETEAVETEPVETEAVETEPVETEAVETEPVETEAVETEPVETEAVETEPVETEAVETEPVETEAVETEPAETEAVETEPVETEAVETEPAETEAEDQENNATGVVVMDESIMEELMAASTVGTGVMGQADIVFAIDTTGSMSNEISNVANNIATFVHRLTTEYNVNANFALVDYRDITVDGKDSTVVVKNGSTNWFTKPADYATVISKRGVYGGGDTPETAVDALEVSRKLDFRASAKKFIIVVTDANYKVNNNYGITSMEQEIELLKAQGIVTSVVTSSSYKSTYKSLYESTGGIYANINGNFAQELLKLADLIGEEVNESNWILLDSYEHIALDAPLSPTSGDTDKDGLSDYEELKTPVKKDYTAMVKFWLFMNGVPTDMIDEYFLSKDGVSVTVYPFKSNPVLPDTDFDGITDKNDTAPRNNTFTGTMMTEHCDSKATYTFDYRYFFKDNKTYYPELSVTSLLFTTFMYCDAGFDHDKAVKTNEAATVDDTKDIRALMQAHGFEDIKIYDLDDEADSRNTNSSVSMLGYSDDDVTEAAFGHRKVTYNGVTKDIVAVFVRGTNGTVEEWSSNFDIGNLALFSYYDEWTEKDNHKGFDITANRMLTKLYDYTGKYTSGELTYWLTGHSRGAAVANIMAAKLVDAGGEVYAYGFATPNTTISTNAKDSLYGGIFNLVNEDDFVPRVPMEHWDFDKYGKTAVLDVTGKMEDEWHDLTGLWVYNQMSEVNMEKLVASLAVVSDGWSDCYVYHCSCHGDGKRDDMTEKIGAGAYIEIPWRVLKHSQTSDETDLLARYAVCQTPAYFLSAMGDLSYKQGKLAQLGKLLDTYQFAERYESARNQMILSKLVSGITQPHYCATYYLLTQYAEGGNFS